MSATLRHLVPRDEAGPVTVAILILALGRRLAQHLGAAAILLPAVQQPAGRRRWREASVVIEDLPVHAVGILVDA